MVFDKNHLADRDRDMGDYLRPERVEDALTALGAGPRAILAGGTDFYPARVGRAVSEDVLDITRLAALMGIAEEDERFRIGALATWSEVIAADLPAYFNGLKLAAREVGGAQIQNAGTVAGNLCNASPAADGVPPLLALGAEVELSSATNGARRLPLADFVLGNRRTARRPDELMTAILVPKLSGRARSTFLKLGARKYLVISIVMVSAVVDCDGAGAVSDARFAVGSCSAAALRLPALERAVIGRKLAADLAELVEASAVAPLAPIDDVRGTAAYRRDAAVSLLRRAVRELAA